MNTPVLSVCLWLTVHKSGKVFIAPLADLFNKVALLNCWNAEFCLSSQVFEAIHLVITAQTMHNVMSV